jgi:hypothetical protein
MLEKFNYRRKTMKRIINGKKYDTDTANCIASDSYGNCGDFAAWEEALYRTKKGQYFITGSGGPMSKYAVSIGNNTTSGSSELWLVDEKEAKSWLEEHGSVEEYENEFGTEEG